MRIVAILFAVILCPRIEVNAQIKHYQHFDVSNGLASNFITDVAVARDGYLWLTSNGGGISRYDGISFEHFTDPQILGDLYFYSIYVADSVIWFGGENAIISYQDRIFKRHEIPGVGAVQRIVDAAADGLFCVGQTKAVLFSINGAQISDNLPAGIKVHAATLAEGVLYAASSLGLWSYANDTWQKQEGVSEIKPGNCSEILLAENGHLLLIDHDHGLISYSTDGLVKVLLDRADFSTQKITFLKEGGVGELFFGTVDEGVLIFQQIDSLWQQLDPAQLRFDHMTNLVFDQWENAWVATAGGGLTKFSTQGFILRDWPELSGHYFQSIQQARDTLFITYLGDMVDYLVPQQSKPEKYISYLANKKITHRDFSTSTSCWVGIDHGLYYRMDSILIPVDLSQDIRAMKVLDSQQIVLATSTNVWQISVSARDSTGLPIFDFKKVRARPVSKLVSDFNDQIWYFSDNQLGVLGSDSRVLDRMRPVALIPFQPQAMLLGTRNGLFVVRDLEDTLSSKAVIFNKEQVGHIMALALDQDGKLWIATRNDILQVSISADLRANILKRYNRAVGLPRLEISENSLAINRQNHVFVATSAGLIEILPEAQSSAVQGPILNLNGIALAGKIYPSLDEAALASLASIDPKNRAVAFSFKAIDQKSPMTVQYFYQLDNAFNEWSLSKTGGEFDFLSLPLGRHNLRVKATNHERLESAVFEIAFYIATPFYLTWWFLAMSVLVFLGLVYLLYRWSLARRLRESARHTETLQLQNRMLRLEQDARRLQMNPHFIFNALQSIQQKISVGAKEQARIDLQAFAKMMRSFLDHSRKEKILLEEEIQLLSQYLQVEQDLKNGAFSFEIEWSDKIDPSFVELPPMLIQPFVENAIKHGMPNNNLPGLLHISFSLKGRYLICTVSDNGPGIDKKVKDQRLHKAAGIEITQKRLDNFFAGQNITPLTFEQRLDERGRVCGTNVTIVLPTQI